MGVSIYYSANRNHKLTEDESTEVDAIIAKYNDEFEYADIAESFSLYHYDKDEPKIIISGATKLPSAIDDIEILLTSIEHWLGCLTEIRHQVKDADWYVHIDDSDATWDGEKWLMQ